MRNFNNNTHLLCLRNRVTHNDDFLYKEIDKLSQANNTYPPLEDDLVKFNLMHQPMQFIGKGFKLSRNMRDLLGIDD